MIFNLLSYNIDILRYFLLFKIDNNIKDILDNYNHGPLLSRL